MASVWRHPQSRFWTACFRDATGRPRRISTKETSRSRALKIAEAFEKAARQKRSMRRAREIIERLNAELEVSGPPTGQTVRQFALQWLDDKGPETKPRTAAFYRANIEKFLQFLREKADEPITDLGKAQIIKFRNALAAPGTLSAQSVNNALKCVRMLLRAARRDDVIGENPAEFVQGVRVSPVGKRTFTIPELKRVLGQADPEWRSLMLFGLYSGQRLGDLALLSWSNIDLEKNELRLVTAKTGKVLLIPLAPPLRRHIDGLFSQDPPKTGPVHPRANAIAQAQGKVSTLSRQFAEILAAAELRPKQSHRAKAAPRIADQLSFHSLRRTATTLLHEAGIPQAVAQVFIGHDSTAIHELYVSVGRESLVRAAAAFPDLVWPATFTE